MCRSDKENHGSYHRGPGLFVFKSQIAQSHELLSSSASDEVRSEGNHPPCQRDISGGVRLKLMMRILQRTPQTLTEACNRQLKCNLRGERTCFKIPVQPFGARGPRPRLSQFHAKGWKCSGPDGVSNMECTSCETERQPWFILSEVVAVIVTCKY